jgi:hypothetical protein
MKRTLLAIALVLGLLAYVSKRAATSGRSGGGAAGRLLDFGAADMVRIRIKRDFWNSLTLTKGPDGTWRLEEPTAEAAAPAAVNRLLATLEDLSVVTTIDLPADDSERHREYGLWQPSLELSVATLEKQMSFVFGSPTADGQGTYCAQPGRDDVYVVPTEAVTVIASEPSAYQQSSPPPE